MTTYGFNFRATSGFVTDGASETYSLGAAYPETRNGITFGWDSDRSANSRDRSTANTNLAGIVFYPNGSAGPFPKFRIDLPSTGSWDIRAAFGDATSAQTQYMRLMDNATTFATYTNVATNSNEFVDATGVVRTAAAWPGSNAVLTRSFGSTTFYIEIGDPSSIGGNNSTIAFVSVTSVAAANAPTMGQMIFALQ